jgi:hypothetical protein
MSLQSRRELFERTGYYQTGDYFDCLGGSGLRSTKIASNADGSQVWMEPTQEGQVMASKADRDVLLAVAEKMGAKAVDPTGLYRNSIHLEARLERSSANSHYDDNNGCPHEDNKRSLSKCLDRIQEQADEELGKIG